MKDKVIIDIEDLNKLIDENNKLKQMWEELEREIQVCALRKLFTKNVVFSYLLDVIKQKYFPKSIKKTVTIEIEAEKEHEVNCGIKDIEELVNNMGCPKMKIVTKD